MTKAAIQNRFECLDQWRGLALILLLVNHGLKHTGYVEGLGRAGVNMFFFISGLLTFLSIQSLATKKRNYLIVLPVKRAWRIIPTLLIYTALVILINGILNGNYEWKYLLTGFVEDSSPASILGCSHLWSIAVEMKFYLISPLLYWIVARRVGIWFGLGVLGVMLVGFTINVCIKLGIVDASVQFLGLTFTRKFEFHVTVWTMMLGFLTCLPQVKAICIRFTKLFAKQKWTIFLGGQLFLTLVAVLTQNAFATTAAGLCLLPIIAIGYYNNIALEGRYAEALSYLGKRTYSIYLVQQLLTVNLPLENTLYRPIGAVASVGVGILFFELVEKRFLKPII